MSMRKAIDQKCKDCIYDPLSGHGTWRQQVLGCTFKDCPLYPYRPLPEGYRRSDAANSGPPETIAPE